MHGEATVSAQPDRVQMDIGIISQASTSQAAADLNSKQSGAVVSQLHALVAAANIKTINFSVNPNYDYPKDGGPPKILGYTANNTVRVELDDLSILRQVIDAATKAGANNVNRLNFVLKDESQARSEALAKAAVQARAGAQALAAALGVKLGSVLRLEEEQPVIVAPGRQVELTMGRAQGAESAAIEPGDIEVHASVILTFELVQ